VKKFLLFCLFLGGLMFALANFQGLANQGKFQSIVVDFREDVPSQQIQQQVKAIAQKYDTRVQLNSDFSRKDNFYTLSGDRELLQELKQSDLSQYVEYIEPAYIYEALTIPNDPDYDKQWNFQKINVEAAWQQTQGKGSTVAVIDTGVSRVRDLQQTEFVAGYDFVNDRREATDDNGHGTHVAGTIAQSTNNNYGVAGIAYEAKIMPLKVLSGSGGGTVADIAEAIKFAADNDADIINMSLGGPGESQAMKEAIEYAHEKGVTVVAAAGNEKRNAASYPARYPHVIAVAATDATGSKASYSNYGAGVDIAAPGGLLSAENPQGGILQNTIDPRGGEVFRHLQGTSMAAPHVAGVAALINASGIDNPDEIEEILTKSARQVKEDPMNYFGAGRLDAATAVQMASEGQIDVRDFLRWLRDNGYLNPRFWFDGGAVMLLPKILMVLGSYILAIILRKYFPFGWNWNLFWGLTLGSSGLFFLRGLYVFDLPQWPLRVAGSSIPELGTAIQGNPALNPIFASVLIPAVLILFLLGHSQWKWLAIGSTIGVCAALTVSAIFTPSLVWLGSGLAARIFLLVNALLCFALARLALKTEGASA
jgi:serine protease